jgi:ADP-ribose pyrophosphatase YjhB (NUDIX family)
MPDPDPAQPMQTRCSVAVFRHGALLLVRRLEGGHPVWRLPGGQLRTGEGLIDCARRELQAETGLRAGDMHCALLLDVHDHDTGRPVVEVVLFPTGGVQGEPVLCEEGHEPRFVPMELLDVVPLQPGIQSELRGLMALHERELADEEEPFTDAPPRFPA